MMHRLDWLLSNRRWWRKLRAGHWERWYIDSPFNADIWMWRGPDATFCAQRTTVRPPLGRGTPRCEDWT